MNAALLSERRELLQEVDRIFDRIGRRRFNRGVLRVREYRRVQAILDRIEEIDRELGS